MEKVIDLFGEMLLTILAGVPTIAMFVGVLNYISF